MPEVTRPNSTALALTHWEFQSTAAERLCADILVLDGFKAIDPQAPRGGPDGGKDILCEKDGVTFVAACHFPNAPVSFAKTKTKFKGDLASSLKHGRDGFIFMTNQHLTPSNRIELERLAGADGKRGLIVHQENFRVALDSPAGYGIRLKHLRIQLSPEEQFAYFASSRDAVAEAIADNTRAIERLAARFERSAGAQVGVMMETMAVILDAVRGEDTVDTERMLRASAGAAFETLALPPGEALSASLSAPLVRYVHRVVLPTSPLFAGRYRQTQVWLQDPTGKINEELECVSWDKVPILVEALLEQWNRNYTALDGAELDSVADAIARFMHAFLLIHPFVDGNGRVARALASIQARDLVGLSEELLIDKGERYYLALQLADKGDFDGLTELLLDAIEQAG